MVLQRKSSVMCNYSNSLTIKSHPLHLLMLNESARSHPPPLTCCIIVSHFPALCFGLFFLKFRIHRWQTSHTCYRIARHCCPMIKQNKTTPSSSFSLMDISQIVTKKIKFRFASALEEKWYEVAISKRTGKAEYQICITFREVKNKSHFWKGWPCPISLSAGILSIFTATPCALLPAL